MINFKLNHRRSHYHGGMTNFTASLSVHALDILAILWRSGREYRVSFNYVTGEIESIVYRSKSGKFYSMLSDVSQVWIENGTCPRLRFYRCMTPTYWNGERLAA